MANRKRKEEEKSEGAPAWMVTYGDMMTLLLTFFVLLLSFSSLQEIKFKHAMGSLKRALGAMPKQSSFARNFATKRLSAGEFEDEELMEETRKLKAEIAMMNLDKQVKVTMTDKGAHIVIADPLLFDLGKAEIRGEVYPLLDVVARLIKNTSNTEVLVEGHTDNWPISNEKFPSNWELSTARALAVVKHFAFRNYINPARLAGVGYGEYRPVKPNNSVENRAKNRRVEIYINKKRGEVTSWLPEETEPENP